MYEYVHISIYTHTHLFLYIKKTCGGLTLDGRQALRPSC